MLRKQRRNKYNNTKIYAFETEKGPFSFKKKDLALEFCKQKGYSTDDMLVFDSTFEYERYCDLLNRQKSGSISDLKRQVRYELIPKQTKYFQRKINGYTFTKKVVERKTEYVADFVYTENEDNFEVVEDTKSVETASKPDFIMKRKLMLQVHEKEIQVVCSSDLKRKSLLLRKPSMKEKE